MKCDICKKEIDSEDSYSKLILPERGHPGIPIDEYQLYDTKKYNRHAKHPTYTREVICCRSCHMKIQDIIYYIEIFYDLATHDWQTKYYNKKNGTDFIQK